MRFIKVFILIYICFLALLVALAGPGIIPGVLSPLVVGAATHALLWCWLKKT